MTALEKQELCLSYAALILHDDGLEITSEKLNSIIKNSGNTVEPYFSTLFARSLKSLDVGDTLIKAANAIQGSVQDNAWDY